MAYLIHIGLALLAQVLGEEAALDATPRLWLVIVACFVPHALGALAHRQYLRGKFRSADRAFVALNWSPVLLHALCLFAGGWVGLLESWTGHSMRLLGWPDAWAGLSFAPFVCFSLFAIDARSRLGLGPSERSRRLRRFQLLRLAAALLPLGGFLAVSASIGASTALRLRIDTVATWNALYAAVLLALFTACLPWLLRNSWETEPMPEGLERSLLESVAAHAKFEGHGLFVWRTEGSVANAAIIGLFPRRRFVLFSDLLLSQLDLRELASVFAHEIGHAKKAHMLIFGAWAFAALFGGHLIAAQVAPDDELWNGAVLIAAMASWAVLFGWMSRRFELEADLYSLRLTGDVGPLIRALEKVSGPHSRARTSWRHFSTERRIAFLEATARDPAVGERLERRLAWLARVGVVLFLAVMALEGLGLARQWPRDQLLLDLRTGDYVSAARRAESRSDLDEDLSGLARRAASLRQGDPAEIERRARAALSAGELQELGQWLDLGALRGDADMDRVAAVLARLQAEPPADERELEALRSATPTAWRDALEALFREVRR